MIARPLVRIGIRSSLAISLALFANAPLSGESASATLVPGAPAPAFVLQTDAGDQLDLASFAGKPLVVNVFASWCPPCRQELPLIVRAARRSAGSVTFVGVDEQEPHQMGEAFARSMRVPYRVVYDDGPFAATYGATSLPVTVFIDARGRLRYVHRGAMGPADLAAGMASLRAPRATPART